jgi:4-aminobutyrate aminotransferase / (S)-3-amino-2-methylpropionate transaminase / 5-aminovalerate transaminase
VIVREGLCDHAATLGEWLGARLADLAARHPVIGDVRGEGLMFGLELVGDRAGRAPAPELAGRVRAGCRERGVLVGVGGFPANVVRIQPPLVISQAQLTRALEALDAALGEVGATTSLMPTCGPSTADLALTVEQGVRRRGQMRSSGAGRRNRSS